MNPPSEPAPATARLELDPLKAAHGPEWTHEDCVQYEVAREAITAVLAYRSQWIFDEQQKPTPDTAAIEPWRSECAQYAAELRGLDVRDRERIACLCREYGAELRRLDLPSQGS